MVRSKLRREDEGCNRGGSDGAVDRGVGTGLTPRVLRTAPACAIMIGSYEVGKVYFTETNNRALAATSSTLRY